MIVRWPLVCLILLACCAAVPAAAVDVKALDTNKGVEVWYVQDHSLPMIALSARLPAGSVYDPPGKPGLAAFAAALADEGAGKLDSQAFQSALNSRGIRLSVTPGRDFLTIQLVTLSANAPEAFKLLGQALSQPRFDAPSIARVRAQLLAGLQAQDEDPAAVAARGFYRAYFHNSPYGHDVFGDPASVNAIQAADLHGFARAHWARGRLSVAVSGDVAPAQLKSLLAAAFAGLPLNPPPLPARLANAGAPGVHLIAMPVPQANIVFGVPALRRSDPDFLPGFVANYILGGGGFASRLMNEVREKRGLTYDISTGLEPLEAAGLWQGSVATKAQSVDAVLGVVRGTMRKFAAGGPTEQELQDAKTYLTGSFPLGFESNVGTADILNSFEAEGLPLDYVQTRNAKIDAVTIEQVRRVAARLFNPKRLTVVAAGPAARGK